MSKFTGNIIRLPAVTPTQNSASGVYTLDDQFTAQSSGTWPIVRDQYFNYTTLLLTGAVQGTAYPNPVTQPYSFLSDASTNNFVVSPNGDVSARPFNPYLNNYSAFFDGTGDYVTVSGGMPSGQGTAFTLECWVYLSNLNDYRTITRGSSGGTLDFGIGSSGQVSLADTGVIAIATTPTGLVQAGVWTHIALTRTVGNLYTIYVNGTAYATGSNSTSMTANTTIGLHQSTASQYFSGYMTNFRVCNALVYSGQFTPSSLPLSTTSQGATSCQLLCFQSNRFIDNSGNSRTITPSGNVAVSQNSPFVSYDTTNGSGYFDGNGDYLSILDNDAFDFGIGDFTISAWVYPTISGGAIIDQGGGGASTNRSFEIFMSNTSTISNAYITSSGSYQSQYNLTGTTTPNAWNFIEFTRSSGTIYLFVNGVQQSSAPANITVYNSTANVFIGETSQSVGNNFGGYISNVRVRKGTGSSSSTVPTAPLQAVTNTSLLTLQTRAPATNNGFIDSSPNNFVVTRNGNATQGSFSPFSPTGWSGYFNGSSNIAPSSGSFLNLGTSNYTIEFFVYLPTNSATNILLAATATNGLVVIIGNTKTALNKYGVGDVVSTGSALSTNVWHHVAIVRAGTGATDTSIYVDGSRVVQGQDNNNWTVTTAPRIGGNQASEFITAYISNLRVVTSAIYSGASITVPTAPLTAISGTTFLTLQNNRFLDNGTTAATFTTTGSPSVQAFSPFAPAQSYIPSQIGGSGYFDGTGDYLTIANQTALQLSGDFTIDGWVYGGDLGNASGQQLIGDYFRNNAEATSQYQVTWNKLNKRISFYLKTSGGFVYLVTSDGTAPSFSWNHFALVRSGSTIRLYCNGVGTSTATDSTQLNSGFGTWIGVNASNTGEIFNGYIANLRVVKGTAIYDPSQSTLTVPTALTTAVSGTSLLLNFTNGGIVDATGKNNLETVGTSAIQTKLLKYGNGSGYLDGTASYVTAANNSGLLRIPGDFTLELWAYRLDATNNTYFCVFGNQTATNNGFLFFVTGGSVNAIRFYSNGAFVMTGTNNTVPLNQWTHIALVRNGTAANNLRVYIDGVEDTAARATNTTTFVGVSGNGLAIGTEYAGSFSGTRAAFYYSNYRLTNGIARYTSNFNTNLPTGPFPLG